MHYDYLIVGQGIAGTFLHWYLQKAGATCMVIDEPKPNTASKVAAGLINPVTGRRLVQSWMIDELLPFAWNAYTAIGNELNIECIYETTILHFFQAPDMQEAFNKKLEQDQQYLSHANHQDWRQFFNYPFSYGIIKPSFIADAKKLVSSYNEKLFAEGKLLREKFDPSQLNITSTNIEYKNIRAGKIIFCDGAANFNNPWFGKLPYSLNKGEALIVKIPGLPTDHVYKFGHTLIPINPQESIFWFGSGNDWHYADELPTEKFRLETEAELKRSLKLPFTIIDHQAAIRPANIERRPFIGLHPAHPQLGIFNGLGTKGCSLTPYFAHQFTNHLVRNQPILPTIDVKRFSGVIS